MAKPLKTNVSPTADARQLDTTKLEHIVSALEYLHGQAALTGCEEIRVIVEATFKTVLAAYYLILRAHAQGAVTPSSS